MSRKPIFIILDEANGKKRRADRVKVLQENSSKELKTILDYTFNDNVKWLLPEGVPPFKASIENDNVLFARLYQEIRRLPIFLNIGNYPNLTQIKRENLFISMLESLHPKDAEILCSMKDKTLPQKNIDKNIIIEAFPIFTSYWPDVKKAKEQVSKKTS